MNQNRWPFTQGLGNWLRRFGGADVGAGGIWLSVKPVVMPLALASLLGACQSQSPYPQLGTVPPLPETGHPVEERRQIVRDLIDDRDVARYRQAIIRHRNGLIDTPPPPKPVTTETRAEDIILEAPAEERSTADNAIDDQSESAYGDRTQFDDGTLDDFIRRLKKDTAPPGDESPVVDDGAESDASEEPEPQASNMMWQRVGSYASASWERDRPLVLAAFAPAMLRPGEPATILLAANGDDRGFLCTYLGWAVAWSNTCLTEEQAGGQAGSNVTADVDDDEAGNQASQAQSEDLPADRDQQDSAGGTAAGRGGVQPSDQSQGSGGGQASASEDLGGDGLLPVSSALDRLRNLIRSRSTRSANSPADRKSLSYEAEELKPRPDDGPPFPEERPEVEKDFEIVSNNHRFEFVRTPRPAFKPLPPESKTVIYEPDELPPEFVPAAKPPTSPADPGLVSDGSGSIPRETPEDQQSKETDLAAIDPDEPEVGSAEDLEPAISPDPLALPESDSLGTGPAVPDDALLLDSELILFDPGSARLPAGVEARFEEMLAAAKANNGKLFIVSEASAGNLAMERARGIGLAFVRMGATADLIEYDIVVDRNADHVQVLLKEAGMQDSDEPVAGDFE